MRLNKDSFSRATQGFRRDVFGRFDTGIWLISVIRLFTAAGFSICIPFLALYLYQERGLPMTLVGAIFLVGGLCSAGSQMVGGVLSDRFGRRQLLLGATGISVLLYAGLSILIGASAPIWAIAVTYIAGRSVLTTIQPTVSAVVSDLSPKNRLTEAYGLMRVGENVGWAAGPAVGGYMAISLSYAWLFGVAALTSVLAFLIILLFFRESFHGDVNRVDFRSMLSVATNRTFLMFTGLSLLVFLGMAHLGSTLSIFTVDRIGFSTAQYGLLLTVNGLIVVFFQYPVARVIDWIGKSRSLILGSLLYGLGYLSLGGIGSFGWALGAIAIITAGEIIFAPTTLSVVGELSPYDWRGRYMGFFGLSQTLGISLGPLVGGVLLDAFPGDPWFIWGTIASIAFVAALGFYWWGVARRASST
ncbi:MAG: MFS transporter [Dehalococcoidia bacterium]